MLPIEENCQALYTGSSVNAPKQVTVGKCLGIGIPPHPNIDWHFTIIKKWSTTVFWEINSPIKTTHFK